MTNVPTVMHKFQEIVVSAAVNSITFSNLNINLDDLYVIHCTIKNLNVGVRQARIFINGDTTVTNYHSQSLIANGAGISAARSNTPIFTDINVAGANGYCYSEIRIMVDIAGYARFIADSVDNTGASIKVDHRVITHNVVAANITSITIDLDAAVNNIGIGSQFLLLRLNRYG